MSEKESKESQYSLAPPSSAYAGESGRDSVDPLEIPLGPMTGARAKRFKEALHVLI